MVNAVKTAERGKMSNGTQEKQAGNGDGRKRLCWSFEGCGNLPELSGSPERHTEESGQEGIHDGSTVNGPERENAADKLQGQRRRLELYPCQLTLDGFD